MGNNRTKHNINSNTIRYETINMFRTHKFVLVWKSTKTIGKSTNKYVNISIFPGRETDSCSNNEVTEIPIMDTDADQ